MYVKGIRYGPTFFSRNARDMAGKKKKNYAYTSLTGIRVIIDPLLSTYLLYTQPRQRCTDKKVIVYKVCGGFEMSIKDPKISRIFLLNFFKGSFSKLCGATIAVSDCFS